MLPLDIFQSFLLGHIGQRSQDLHGFIAIMRNSFQDLHRRSRIGCDRSIETILNPMIETFGIEILKGFEEDGILRRIVGGTFDRSGGSMVPSCAKEMRTEISDVSYENKDCVAKVGGGSGKEGNGRFDLCFGHVGV